jgi:tetratricopeptide (TPR) repeat protein
MGLVGRSAEVGELAALLDRAAAGFGGVITLVGAAGSGKSALAAEAAALARDRGFEVAGGSAVRGRPGRLVWAGLLDDLGADPEVTRALLDESGPLDTTMAVRLLAAGTRRLIVVDDVDAGGQEAVDMLALVAARLVTCSTAVVATAATSLGVGRDLKLCGLCERDLAAIVGEMAAAGQRHAVWVASRGMPGIARTLAGQLADLPPGRDALVHLALHAAQRGEFLGVDDGVVRLIEMALARAADDASRARLLARLSRELLGDPLAGPRRRSLADEALMLAGRAGDGSALAEVLDARLYALWDPAGAQDRLDAASELIRLGREAGDGARERDGLFWRFIALMELARVDEAEVALAAFERAAVAAGDAEAAVMALSRHGMLAIVRGRFEAAAALAGQVSEQARRIGMPDAERLTMTVRGLIDAEQGDERSGAAATEVFDQMARRFPGHLYEATLARILAVLGRTSEAAALLERLLPQTLAASGPRWLGAVTDLSAVAAEVGGRAAAARLYEALLPYQGRLVTWGGANAVNGPASYYLGLLAARLGRTDDAVTHFEDAIGLAERIGARPALARSLVELGEALTRRGDDGDARRAADLLRRSRDLASELGLTVLIRRLATAPDEWSLRPDGDGWLLRAGPEHARLPDNRGVRQLRTLLASPRRGIPALDLAAGGSGLRVPAAPPVLDAAAAASYRRRLGELTAELDAADAAGDSERASRAEAERQWLLAELRRATGLGGRARRATTESERARVNVTRTLRAVISHIGAAAPQAGAYLQASVRTGLECRYDPAPGGPSRWSL